jgi:potassium/hydrogen antiporter
VHAPETVIAIASGLAVAAIVASRLSSRFGVPVLLVFLGIGMLAGSDGPGGIEFTNAHTAQLIGVGALVLILFSGGLSTSWQHVRPAVGYAAALGTAGVLVTSVIVGAFATWLLGVPAEVGLLVGAIVSSTDAAAVFTTLRGSGINLRDPLGPILELESGGNDPMAVFLTLGLVERLVHPHTAVAPLAALFVLEMVVGGVGGFLAGKAAVRAINRLRLDFEGMYPVLTLAIALLTFALTTLLHGSGFLAVYVAGIVVGNSNVLHKRSLVRFLDAIAWLAQIGMFLSLGLLVFPSRLWHVAGDALLLAVVLIVLARPIAVLLTLGFTRITAREQLFVSWVGLRGAVPIVLATFPLVRGVPHADLIFDVVFFVVITSVGIQGTTTAAAARLLGVSAPMPARPRFPIESIATTEAGTTTREFVVQPGSIAANRTILDLALPAGILVVLVNRADAFLVAQGSTKLEAGDRVLVVSDATGAAEVTSLFAAPDSP